MGQAASRNRAQTPAAPVDSTPSEAGTSTAASSLRTASRATKRSRTSSLRQSVLGLLPHSRSSSSLNSSPSSHDGAQDAQPPKKRWRSSKRWSKAPAMSSDESTAVESTLTPAVEEEVPVVVTSPYTPPPEEPPHAETDLASEPEQRSVTDRTPPTEHSILAADEHSPSWNGSTLRDEHESYEDNGELAQPTPASEQAPRPYPQPGTLVVVQGVVNTTDSQANGTSAPQQRPSRSSTPRPVSGVHSQRSSSAPREREGERLGTRNRLSSFISRSRPSSEVMSGSNRNSAISSDSSPGFNPDPTPAEDATSYSEQHDNVAGEADGRPRPLSPASIDVLGTLLSVAAAATAASLFSPGIAFPGHGNGTATATPGSNRPMSPTPTAGLGTLAGLAGLGMDPLGVNPGQAPSVAQVQRDGRDRIRNVWENMRDRLGLHSRNSVLGGLNSTQSDGASDRMRPGDMMLAEMARALNIGLGLPNDNSVPTGTSSDRTGPSGEAGSGGNTSSQTVTADSADRPAPAEDSFERFLLNLRNDLRIALSEDGAAERPQRDSVHSSHSSSSTTPAQQDLAPVAGPSSMRSGTPVNQSEYPVSESEDPDEDNPPPLEDGSDSEDEYDADDDEDMDDEHDEHDEHDHGTDTPRSPRSPTPIPGSFFDHRYVPDGGRRAPGVNLWRLYRFQPIPASQTQGHAATTSATASHRASVDATSPASPEAAGSATSDSHPPSSTTTHPLDTPAEGAEPSEPQAPSPAATDPNANVVVPVIVVGLQSVDMGRTHNHAHGAADHTQPSDDVRSTESSLGSAENWRNQSSTAPMDIPSRGRPWRSRAADALRPLLPGRRSGSHNRQSTDANGARTFLIYVIGGYYPPNHHMVTGSDSLDSYEALWELAELLGQVKPPVATREDIDNSGLQIIKAHELRRCEEEGRVSSNCVERCLICLDDYEPEDDLRLMTCRHAFHKECVDKWLQVGRNNCPACRSKGVSTASDSNPL